jgi:hypothetical protein
MKDSRDLEAAVFKKNKFRMTQNSVLFDSQKYMSIHDVKKFRHRERNGAERNVFCVTL